MQCFLKSPKKRLHNLIIWSSTCNFGSHYSAARQVQIEAMDTSRSQVSIPVLARNIRTVTLAGSQAIRHRARFIINRHQAFGQLVAIVLLQGRASYGP